MYNNTNLKPLNPNSIHSDKLSCKNISPVNSITVFGYPRVCICCYMSLQQIINNFELYVLRNTIILYLIIDLNLPLVHMYCNGFPFSSLLFLLIINNLSGIDSAITRGVNGLYR